MSWGVSPWQSCMTMINCLIKKRQKKGRMCFMALSNQFIKVIVEGVNIYESGYILLYT